MTTGAQNAAAAGWSMLSGQKVGVITNPTGILSNLRTIVDEMHESGAVNIVGVFGPEHGFRGTAQAGDSEGTHPDPRTGLTVYDAYGANTAKMTTMFRTAGVETVVFDIQDVGARFYTYIWTMYTAMQAAVAVGARFVVLDRPNPIGGTAIGPMMTTPWTSGVGAKEIVQAHGMTVGELARYFDGEFLTADAGRRLAELSVIEVKGWRRDVPYAVTGLPWVMPSPNMPTPDTALVYPGTGMFEGTNLSEGRGTTRPFELIGAPYVDYKWAERLAALGLPGVGFREAYFSPDLQQAHREGVRRGAAPRHRPLDVRPDPLHRRDARRGQGAVSRLRLALRLLRPGTSLLDRQADRLAAAAHADLGRRSRRRGRRRLARRARGLRRPAPAVPPLPRPGALTGRDPLQICCTIEK